MADKAIGQLIAAERVKSSDLFVLEQDGAAKKLTGQILENWLLEFAEGHGGIQKIEKTSTSGLIDNYRITLSDETTYQFQVKNGKAISSITQYFAISSSGSSAPSSWSTSRQSLTSTSRYLWSYFRYTFNDSTYTDTTKTVIGVYGDTGLQTYVHFKWSTVANPTSSDMGNIPADYIGIYSGTSSSAPTSPSSYKWYLYKGEKGNKGDNATIVSNTVTYQVSTSGTVAPSGSWTSSIPTIPQGQYLWTRVVLTFNTGSPVTYYAVSRNGLDGSGAVSSVNQLSPDGTGNITLTANDISMADNTSVQATLADAKTKAYGAIQNGTGVITDTMIADGAVSQVFTATIPASGWSNGTPSSNTISIPSVLSTDNVIIDVRTVAFDSVESQEEAFSLIYRAVPGDGNILFYAKEKPSIDIPVRILCIRK